VWNQNPRSSDDMRRSVAGFYLNLLRLESLALMITTQVSHLAVRKGTLSPPQDQLQFKFCK
jgi:hypothetical protein